MKVRFALRKQLFLSRQNLLRHENSEGGAVGHVSSPALWLNASNQKQQQVNENNRGTPGG